MEITCNIAMDLVDIYTSGAASVDTEKAVEEHLKTCKECRGFYDGYRKNLDEEKKDEQKNNCIRVETSPYIADEILSESIKKLTKRIKTRRIISNTVGIVSIVMAVIVAIGEFARAVKGDDK